MKRKKEGSELKPLGLSNKVVKLGKGVKESSLSVEFEDKISQKDAGLFVYAAEVSNYHFGDITKEDNIPHSLESLELINPDNTKLSAEEDIKFYQKVGECKNLARDLCNGRVNHVNIPYFVELAEELKKNNPEIELVILKDQELVEEGMMLNYSVGMGSVNKPAFINMTYKGNSDSSETHAIIGKGVVFDTGGYNIKPTGFMEDMYVDKGGASAVFGAFKGIVESNLKVNVTCSIPLAENCVSSNAYKPSDIIKSHNGLTVEITNTDAEGRLILADAMSWTQKNHDITSMVELSTLTGACVVALGLEVAGLFFNNDGLKGELKTAGDFFSEDLWPLPIYDSMRKGLKGADSDLVNSSKNRYGGAIEAAAFLENFVEEDVKWAHVDIAGPAKADAPWGIYDKGATGFGVGFLMQRFKNIDASVAEDN